MVGLSVVLKSGVPELDMLVKEGGAISGGIPAGSTLPFAFTDGSVLTLGTIRDNPTQPYTDGTTVMTNVPYSLGVDSQQIHLFATTPLQAVRVAYPGGTYDWQVKKAIQDDLMTAFQCVESKAPAASAPPAAGPPAP